MIVGQNYIFVAVPKVASTSLRTAIVHEPFLFQHDPYKREFIPGIGESFYNSHVPLSMVAPHVDIVNRIKIGFVRNPFDRFISYCAWSTTKYKSRDGGILPFGFVDRPQKYMDIVLRMEDKIKLKTTMIWEQSKFLTLEPDKIGVDFLGRYETLQQSYDELCEKMGFKKQHLPVRNVSQRDDYRRYYTTELVDKVAEYYKRDIQLFGYKFE